MKTTKLVLGASLLIALTAAFVPSASATPVVDCTHEFVVSEQFTTIGTLGQTQDENSPIVDALVNNDDEQARSKAIAFASGGYENCLE